MRKLILVTLFLPLFALAQDATLKVSKDNKRGEAMVFEPKPDLNYAMVDSLSLGYFYEPNYQALCSFGEQALNEKIDFYALRARLGIAYFKRGNFEKAWYHLLNAIEKNPSEESVVNYAYYSLLNTAQYARANELLVKYPFIQTQLKPKTNGLSSIEVEPGSIITPNSNNFKDKQLNGNNFYGEGNIFTSMNYGRLYAEGLLNPNLKFHLAANLFQSNHLSIIDLFNTRIVEAKSNLNQQYNLGFSGVFNHGWGGGIGIGYYYQNFVHPYLNYTQPLPPPGTEIRDTSEKSSFVTFATYISKRNPYTEWFLFLNYGNFNLEDRVQAEIGLTTFPLGKEKLYTYTGFSSIRTTGNTSFAIQQKLGYTIKNRLTLEGNFLQGSLTNYSSNLGFMTLNTFDPLKWSAGIDVSVHFPKFTLTPGYRYQKRTGTYYSEEPVTIISSVSHTYFNHLLFITLKCQF